MRCLKLPDLKPSLVSVLLAHAHNRPRQRISPISLPPSNSQWQERSGSFSSGTVQKQEHTHRCILIVSVSFKRSNINIWSPTHFVSYSFVSIHHNNCNARAMNHCASIFNHRLSDFSTEGQHCSGIIWKSLLWPGCELPLNNIQRFTVFL